MQFPLSWLKEYLSLPESIVEIEQAFTSIGIEVEHIHPLEGGDVAIKVSLTPNLAHCNSIRGLARELAAYYGRTLLETPLPPIEEGAQRIEGMVTVRVEARESCPSYSCRILQGVKVCDSPQWMQARLIACGLRPVNHVVDATNFVMLQIGQPLHAFDYDTLQQKQIVVRAGRPNDVIVTLDDQERFPTEEMLLICDAEKPIALAGVMGSKQTQITSTTQTVLLESAYFSPTAIRRGAKRVGMCSEASYRFERGVDPQTLHEALDRAATLIVADAGGQIVAGTVDIMCTPLQLKKISLRLARIERILGIHVAASEVIELLRRLDLIVESRNEVLHVTVPSYRHDLNIEIDLIEELARFYGYDHLHREQKAHFCMGSLPDNPLFLFEQEVRRTLLGQGLQELLTCDLISEKEASLVDFHGRQRIQLLNPSSVDQSILRHSLLPGHLSVVTHNADHEHPNVSGYEIGRIHFKVKDAFHEQSVAGIVMTGQRDPHSWQQPKGVAIDFFALKGVVEESLRHLRLDSVAFAPGAHTAFHPYRQAVLLLAGQEVGVLGEIHPNLSPMRSVYYAELHLEQLLKLRYPMPQMHPLPLFPSSTRDWTVHIAQEIHVQELFAPLATHSFPLLEHASLLDLYHGERVGSEWKSITLRFVYRDREKTIAQQAVEHEHARVTQSIMETLNGKMKK